MVIGQYKENYTLEDGELRLRFYLESFPVEWEQMGVLADFFSNYMASYFPPEAVQKGYLTTTEVVGIAGYALNELFENAIKFNYNGEVNVSIGLENEELILLITNYMATTDLDSFQEKLNELAQDDIAELLIRKVEQNFVENKGSSGLGLLSLIQDYKAVLGWKFEKLEDVSGPVVVNTMARLSVKK
jgi:hypothetical protein